MIIEYIVHYFLFPNSITAFLISYLWKKSKFSTYTLHRKLLRNLQTCSTMLQVTSYCFRTVFFLNTCRWRYWSKHILSFLSICASSCSVSGDNCFFSRKIISTFSWPQAQSALFQYQPAAADYSLLPFFFDDKFFTFFTLLFSYAGYSPTKYLLLYGFG